MFGFEQSRKENMLRFDAMKVAKQVCDSITHKELTCLFRDLCITKDIPDDKKEEFKQNPYVLSKMARIANALCFESDDKIERFLQIIKTHYPEIELPYECKMNNIKNDKHFDNQDIQKRYEELIKAINQNMPLSFFWLAGSIIEGVLCEYCKKNNIKSSKDDIDGYITALENNNKISKGSTIYTTLQHFRLFRNTIHPNNQNNDFISNLQNRKEELDDVIQFFLG